MNAWHANVALVRVPDSFWPEPGMAWICWLLGAVDLVLLGFIAALAWRMT